MTGRRAEARTSRGRTSVVLGLLLAEAVLLLLRRGEALVTSVLGRTSTRRGRSIEAAIGLASMAFAIVTDARISSPEPALSPSAWSSFASCVEAGDRGCEVAIAPEGWRVTAP